MTGCNSLTICHAQLNAMLTKHLNDHVFNKDNQIEVLSVKTEKDGYSETFVITLEPAKQPNTNQTPPCQS